MSEFNSVEAARLVNAASRLMSVYQQGILALRNIQLGHDPRITLQQVNVSGGNTVVAATIATAAMPTSVSRTEQKNEELPHAP
jgi:hypothetical protein